MAIIKYPKYSFHSYSKEIYNVAGIRCQLDLHLNPKFLTRIWIFLLRNEKYSNLLGRRIGDRYVAHMAYAWSKCREEGRGFGEEGTVAT